jgi:DNA/RNA non-specific endonuclease
LLNLPNTLFPSTSPQHSSPTHKITQHGYDFEIDQIDRTRRVSGTLKLNSTQGRSRPNQNAAGKPDRLPSDHGGHYIAREFNGPTEKFNHLAQDAKINQSAYRSLEIQWGKLIKKGHKVTVDIVPHYEGQSQRPSSIDVTYYIDGERQHQSFPNSRKGK